MKVRTPKTFLRLARGTQLRSPEDIRDSCSSKGQDEHLSHRDRRDGSGRLLD